MAWAWVKEYTEKFLNASDDAKFDKRAVIGGMADIFGRSLIALRRIKYAVFGHLNFAANLCMFGKPSLRNE